MNKIITTIAMLVILVPGQIFAQYTEEEDREPYNIKPAIDIPITLLGTGATIYGFYKISEKSGSDSTTIVNLSYDADVSRINQDFTSPRYSEQANKDSDILFYGSMALPLTLLFDKQIRHDALEVGLLYWETMAITGSMYTLTAANVDKYRPLVYSSEAPLEEKMRDQSKNSFFGGHPAVVASSSFFVAKVVADYYPERKGLKAVLYTSAGALTVTTGYLRYRAGKHFMTDIAIGSLLGTLNGILIPELHKKKDNKLDLSFFSGDAHGVALRLKI
ncbi:phosphatase PAP2 family protein [Fulvivirga sp. RKSG066]|uniref:phosphatase PAP2 family protein n=1 Tax=Fulvivirga aurantia TaxID=2529383 RepID=UPI0012BC0790|nr:phosphatase PAP2 family protein [Fulvivirga aurantia]MTI21329.1 phosphatase PAP2 family protein [Fulvivirga aurantia]